jgi:signal transduction histidine kinase
MRNGDMPAFIDWLAFALRWLVLLGLSASLLLQSGGYRAAAIAFLAAGVWNSALTILAFLNRRFSTQHALSVAVDLVIANLLFYFSGALQGPLVWAGLLPVFTAALYFETRGVLLVTLLSIASLGIQALVLTGPADALLYAGIASGVYLVFGLFFRYLSRNMLAVLEKTQRERLKGKQEAEKAERERRHAIFNLVSALSATLNYQRVLDTALDLSTSALATPTAPPGHLVSAVLLFSASETKEARLNVGSAHRLTPADMRIGLPGTSGLIGRAIDEGQSRLTKTISRDPEISRFVALRACRSAYCVPLRMGLDAFGVLLFAHPDPDFFTPERREILDIVGNQAVIAIQNARLYRDLELEKERMMEIQEEARKKLARDLHDGPTQSVAALAMRVNFARRLLERDGKAAAEELFKVEDLARRTTKEIRHMLFTLRPLVLESEGLIAALESMAEKMYETFSQNVTIAADQNMIPELEMNKQAVIFSIAEEAVNNARKHARAEHIWVRLKPVDRDMALLEIEDDGVGFNTNAVESTYETRGSLGMVNMRERAELVNGVLSIDSAEGRGTQIQLLIPLSEEASERLRHRT